MKLSRDFTIKINYFLDQFIPPIIRDSKWFMYLPFKIFFKDKADIFFNFKEIASKISSAEYEEVYLKTLSATVDRETDLNKACMDMISKSILGERVLDAGCGGGYLAGMLSKKYIVTGADINPPSIDGANPIFVKAAINALPFESDSFDTVICAHTLEHVLDFDSAVGELRRVAKLRLIIVVPRQRPYKYTFDLHVRFFPYAHTLLMQMKNKNGVAEYVSGDILYIENLKK